MNEKIFKALNHHFQSRRIIFWYDDGGKMRDEYREYNELGVEKEEIENNEFYIRYLVQKLNPDKQYLLYSSSVKPEDSKNWLLDLNLSNFVFASDEASMYLQELGLPDSFLDMIRDYLPFYRNKKERLNPLKEIISPETDSEDDLKLAMISILAGSSKNISDITVSLFLDTVLNESPVCWSNIEKYNLDKIFWRIMESEFSYIEPEPDLSGLLNFILRNAFDFQLKRERRPLQQQIFTTVDSWRNNLKYSSSFNTLLDLKERELNISHDLQIDLPLDVLIDIDLFKEADRQIFSKLLEGLENNTIDHTTAFHILEKRRETYWYKNSDDNKLKDHYKALYQYLNFTDLYKRASLDFKSLKDGWAGYTSELYQIDTAYRKFINYYQKCSSSDRFAKLLEKLDREYTEGFMQKLSLSWQQSLDREKTLSGVSSVKMTDFFDRYVAPYLDQDQFLFVIISDGLRYEVGAGVSDAVERQNRFKVELTSMISPVPSYTQLGMASLLPHETLTISDDGETVFADGKTTKGLENRWKILQSYLDFKYKGKKAKAMQAREFLELPMSEQEELIKGIDLFYLFSPGIDSVGENPKTEKNLPKAAEDEINFICDLSKKIVNLNRTHILVTADHGYLYSYNPVPETEWIKLEAESGEIKKDHRFMMAEALSENPGADIIDREELDWEGPFRLQTARGVSLIRRPGGGSRYVHGGRMIQELCVPLLILKKSRIDDVSTVEISVIDRKSDITTGQVSIKFIQESPVENKVQPREIIAVFEGEKGIELSNIRKLIFDSSNPNDQNRSRIETFIFNKSADLYNGKIVYLKLYDLKSGNTKVFYKDFTYRFKKSIQSDFDF